MILIYFLLGIVFISFIVPIIESILTFICTWMEYRTIIYSAETYKIKQALTSESDTVKTVVGFAYDEGEEE